AKHCLRHFTNPRPFLGRPESMHIRVRPHRPRLSMIPTHISPSVCLLRGVICHIMASPCGTKKEQVIIPAALELHLQGRSLSDGITRAAGGGYALLSIVCAILLIRGPSWAAQSRCTYV